MRAVSRAFLLTTALAAALTAAAAPAANKLLNADFARLAPGTPPPKPWQTGGKDPAVIVAAGDPDGAGRGWLHLRDDSAGASAALRQKFAPLSAGSFSLKIRPTARHASQVGIYLGIGTASSVADRVIDMKTNGRGLLQVGTASEREASPIEFPPDTTTWLFVQWRPNAAGDNLDVVYGTLDEQGKLLSSQRLQLPVKPQPISVLRLTTDKSATGADFYVTDLRIMPLP